MGLYAESGAMLLAGAWQRENTNKEVEWKAFVDTYGVESADFKDKLLFKSYAAFRATLQVIQQMTLAEVQVK